MILNIDESQNIEYKESWNDKYLEWICGFANAQGGRIFIGVNDAHEVVGVADSKRLMEDIPNKIVTHLGIVVDVNLHNVEDLDYIEITVEPCSVPISYRGHYHYRSGSTKQVMTGIALEDFLLKKIGKQWDDLENPSANIDCIDPEAIKYFIRKGIKAKRIAEDALGDTAQEVLENLHLISDDGHLRNAAILLFAKDPQKFFSGIQFKIGRFGKDEADLIFQDVVEGNILQMADKVMELLKGKYLKSPIHYEGMQRIEPLEIPEEALREMLYNSIVHKLYVGAPIQMKVFDSHIELWNEGLLPSGFTIETLWKKHLSRPRNMKIAEVFNKAGFIEAWGRGFKKIREGFESESQELPVYEEFCGGLLATITRPDVGKNVGKNGGNVGESGGNDGGNVGKSGGNNGGNVGNEKLTERQRKIYHLVAAIHNLSVKQMAVMLNISERTLERELAVMQKKEIIRHEGKSRTGHWVVLEVM